LTDTSTRGLRSCQYGNVAKVGVFISWSGNSHGIATTLYEWLPTALHSVNPWVSDYDIHKGTRFLEEIDRALASCKAGIICLTPENTNSIWLAFEAGALASRVTSSKLVIPLVFRMRPTDVPGPLGMFQATRVIKSEMLQLVKALNALNAEEDAIPEHRLEATFEGVWPELEKRLPDLEREQTANTEVVSARKSDPELIEEILDVSKSIRILLEDQARNPISIAGNTYGDTNSAEPLAQAAISSGAGLVGRETYPEVSDHILNASEIWLAGVSLESVMRQFFASFSDAIGHERLNLRFLLLDSEDDLLIATASRSLYGVSSPTDLRQDISTAVSQVEQLQALDHSRSSVQLRYMRNLPSTSLIMVNPMSGNGNAIAEYYPYRASASDRPHIFLNETNRDERKWFVFYRDQFLAMWRDARKSHEVDDAD
jgi:TIR domain